MRGVMPTSPWVLTIAGLMWIALVAAAAWVGSNTGVLPDVLSTVLGTAAGLAFAATGLAAYGDQRRKRRQRKDFEHIVVSHLRVAFRTSNRLAHILVELSAVDIGILADSRRRDSLAELLSPSAHPVAPGMVRVLCEVVRDGSLMDSPEKRLVKVLFQAKEVNSLLQEDPEREHNLFLLRLWQLVTRNDDSEGHRHSNDVMTAAIRRCSASLSASIDLLLSQLELLGDYQFEALCPLEKRRLELRANLDLWRMEMLELEGERSTWLRGATADLFETFAGLSSALSISSRELFDHMATQGFTGSVNRYIGQTDLISVNAQQHTFESVNQDLTILWDRERLPRLK